MYFYKKFYAYNKKNRIISFSGIYFLMLVSPWAAVRLFIYITPFCSKKSQLKN